MSEWKEVLSKHQLEETEHCMQVRNPAMTSAVAEAAGTPSCGSRFTAQATWGRRQTSEVDQQQCHPHACCPE